MTLLRVRLKFAARVSPSGSTMLGFPAIGKRSGCPNNNRRPKAPVVPFPRVLPPLRTGIHHCYPAPVLRPARKVATDCDRPLLAVGDRPHAMRLDATRGQIFAHGLGTARAERDVVLARAALVGVA